MEAATPHPTRVLVPVLLPAGPIADRCVSLLGLKINLQGSGLTLHHVFLGFPSESFCPEGRLCWGWALPPA